MGKPYSIFLAEDSADDVFLIREALTHAGLEYELFRFDDCDGATSLLNRIGHDVPSPDIVLLDLNLPKTDGIEMLRLLRTHAECQTTPVIVMSSSNLSRDRDRAVAAGALHYFCKPLDLAEFFQIGEIVRSVVEQQTH